MAEQSNRGVERRSAAEDPRPGDVVGYFLASNAPLKRTVVEVSGNPCPAFTDYQRARMVKVWYRNQHDQLRSCSLYSWRQWLNHPTPSLPWPAKAKEPPRVCMECGHAEGCHDHAPAGHLGSKDRTLDWLCNPKRAVVWCKTDDGRRVCGAWKRGDR